MPFELRRASHRAASMATATAGVGSLAGGAALAMLLTRLVRQSELTSLVVRSTRNAVLVGDRRGRVAPANRAFGRLAGTDPAKLAGLPLEAAGPTGHLLAKAICEGRAVEVLWRTADGTCRCLSVDVIPWTDRRGRTRGGMAVLRDITAQWEARQRAEREKVVLQDLARRGNPVRPGNRGPLRAPGAGRPGGPSSAPAGCAGSRSAVGGG